MPDTGAPWNIPYVENADLVRDWPGDSLAVANAVAAGLSAASNAGIGSNVVQAVKTNTFTSTSTSFEDVTGLSVTITPSSATAKVLILAYFVIGTSGISNDRGAFVRLNGGNLGFVGDLVGSRSQATAGINRGSDANFGTAIFAQMTGLSVIDSPASASAVTYTVQLRTTGDNAHIGREGTDGNASTVARYPSSLIAIEVAP